MLMTDSMAVPMADSEFEQVQIINVGPVPAKVRTKEVTEMVFMTLMNTLHFMFTRWRRLNCLKCSDYAI